MIRTGIYDGYTPGPWKLDDRIWEMHLGLEPDVMLMQDAPLLLEEVKRLRRQMDSVRDWVREFEDEHMMSTFKIWIGEEE